MCLLHLSHSLAELDQQLRKIKAFGTNSKQLQCESKLLLLGEGGVSKFYKHHFCAVSGRVAYTVFAK